MTSNEPQMSAQSAEPAQDLNPLLGDIDMSTPSVDFGSAEPSGIVAGDWEAAYGDAGIGLDSVDSVDVGGFAADVFELFGEPEVWDVVEDYSGLAETDDTGVSFDDGLDPDTIDDIGDAVFDIF